MPVIRVVGWTLVIAGGITGTVMVVGGMLDDLILILRARTKTGKPPDPGRR